MVEGRTSLRARILLALGATLLALLAAEFGLRLAAPQLVDTEWLTAHPPDAQLGRYRRPSADMALAYELKPDLEFHFGGSVVHTDARCLRVPPQPAPPPPDALELVVLGDSVPFGWRVNYEQGFAALVAAQLQASWGRPVHLTNRSVPGYNSEQQLRVLERDVLPDPPDLLIWHMDHNDANAVLEPYQAIVLPPEAGDNALGSALLKALRRGELQCELELRLHEQQPHERLGGYVTSGPLWERHVAALERGAQETRAAGIPTLFILFDCDMWFGKESEEHVARLHDPLLSRMRAAGADVLDLYPLLQTLAAAQDWKNLQPLWQDATDPHPSARYHELLAGMIAGSLRARWPTPPERP